MSMSLQRIWALVLRYLYASRDPSRATEFVFWPMIDIGFMGLIAMWAGGLAHGVDIINMFVTALVLWQLTYRANYEVCFNVLDEFYDQNLSNLVSTPLTQWEWIVAMMLSGLMKITFTLLFGASIGWLFFNVNIFAVGLALFPFILICLLSGWIIGFLGAGILIYNGTKLQQVPWIVITLAALFSTIYYPLEILPSWMKAVSQCFPMTYMFEGLRELLSTGTISTYYWVISLILSFVYLALALKFFFFMFEKSRQRGFARLT